MEILSNILSVLNDSIPLLVDILAVVGALKLIARRTKTEVDDKVLEAIEWPIRKLLELRKK